MLGVEWSCNRCSHAVRANFLWGGAEATKRRTGKPAPKCTGEMQDQASMEGSANCDTRHNYSSHTHSVQRPYYRPVHALSGEEPLNLTVDRGTRVFHLYPLVVLVVRLVERWTRDRKVAGSTPGRGAIKSTRLTQPSIPPG